jgi:hypothetical protein
MPLQAVQFLVDPGLSNLAAAPVMKEGIEHVEEQRS